MKESLGTKKLGALLLVAAAVFYVGWQIGSCEVANRELTDDLQDIAMQVGTKIGLDPIRQDSELRAIVIRRADDYGIELKPEQVSVQRSGNGEKEVIRIGVEYDRRVQLLVYSFRLHFAPSSGSR